jgi:hypothetical protein
LLIVIKWIVYFCNRYDFLRDQENRRLGVEFKIIAHPSSQDFVLPDFSYEGYPQLTLACKDVC